MGQRLDDSHSDRARATIPAIWVASALSVLLHVAVLWEWLPRVHEPSLENRTRGKASGPLIVQLAPVPSGARSSPPHAAPPVPSSPKKRAPPANAGPRPAPPPRVIARDRPAAPVDSPPLTPSAATPAPAPVEPDFWSHLEARRRARGAASLPPPSDGASSPSASDDDTERHNRIVAANLGLDRTPTYGRDLAGGGIFQIQRIGYEDAEFIFFGWNRDIRRRSKQTIEVRKGENSDIRIAVIRRMIAIIRDNESGDFVWVSQRLGRNLTLSARPSENAGLEDFLMQEFFADPLRPH
jgi:hypothetical protein